MIHHTGCGLFGETNESMREHVHDSIGLDPVDIEFHPIADLEESVREDVSRIRACEFLPSDYQVRGAIYDVADRRAHPGRRLTRLTFREPIEQAVDDSRDLALLRLGELEGRLPRVRARRSRGSRGRGQSR